METWEWFQSDGQTYFISEKGARKKNKARFELRDLMEASASEDYDGLKIKYLLSDRDVSILKTALKNGRWRVSKRASLN